MRAASSAPREVECPRCGYDLRGAVESWDTACPLAGTCAECGLALNWAEVLCPAKFEPQWCVEFIRRRRRFPQAAVSTFLRSWWPLEFWSALKMSMALRWRRLLLYAATLLLPILLGYVAMRTMAAVRMRYEAQQSIVEYQRELQRYMVQLQTRLATPGIRAPDPARLRAQLQQAQTAAGAATSVNHSYAAAIAEAVLTPWRSSSAGTITAGGVPTAYTAPRDLLRQCVAYQSRRWTRWDSVRPTTCMVLLGVWMWLLVPISFVMLPVSRRRAKVRWAHLARVTAYSTFAISVPPGGSLVLAGIGFAWPDGQSAMFLGAHLLLRLVPMPVLAVWWGVATGRYLRLSHSWLVAGLLGLLCGLLFLAVVLHLAPWLILDYR